MFLNINIFEKIILARPKHFISAFNNISHAIASIRSLLKDSYNIFLEKYPRKLPTLQKPKTPSHVVQKPKTLSPVIQNPKTPSPVIQKPKTPSPVVQKPKSVKKPKAKRGRKPKNNQ